jgi:hypothetical protein
MRISDKEFQRLPSHLQELFVVLPNPGRAEVLECFPDADTHGEGTRGGSGLGFFNDGEPKHNDGVRDFGDSGSAARFFASFPGDENGGPQYADLDRSVGKNDNEINGSMVGHKRLVYTSKADADDRLGSRHPTVKPLDLIQYLVRLITPPGGTVLDIFAGTGTTAEAAFREGFRCILIEKELEYVQDIGKRLSLVMSGPDERRWESIKKRGQVESVDTLPLFGGV